MKTPFRPVLALLVSLVAVMSAAAKEHWTKISTPYQTILTADRPGPAKEWAAALEAFHQHLQTLAPTDNRLLDPMIVVIFPNEKAFRAAATPFEKQRGLEYSASVWDQVNGRFIAAVNPYEEESARYSVFLQSSMWLTSSYHWPLPLWLVTGLEFIYAGYSLDGNRMEIGGEVENMGPSLSNGLRIPMDQMFNMTTASPTYQAHDGYFNAQAWAFVHFMMFGENGANRPALCRFMMAIQRGEAMEASLALLAPNGMADLETRFTRYVRHGVYHYEQVSLNLDAIRREVTVEPATDLEVSLSLGYINLRRQGILAATPYFDRATQLAPHAPETLEALAEVASFRNDELERNRLYGEAVNAGSKSYLARYYAVYPSIMALAGAEAAADGTDAAAARAAFDRVKTMLRDRPAFRQGHETLAMMAGALHEVNDDDGALLLEGAKLYPNDAVMITGLAAYEITKRRLVDAKHSLDRLRNEPVERLNWVAHYAQKLDDRMLAENRLMWLEKYYAEGKFDDADKVLAVPNGLRRLLPSERERVAEIRSSLGAKELLSMAREAIGRKEWDGADSLLAQVEGMKLPPAVSKEAAELRSSLTQAKAAKAVR